MFCLYIHILIRYTYPSENEIMVLKYNKDVDKSRKVICLEQSD